MTYIAKVVWYNDLDVREEKINLFISGESYKDVVEKLSVHFGEEDILSMEIEPFAPDDFLIFEEQVSDLFDEVVKGIGERVIW